MHRRVAVGILLVALTGALIFFIAPRDSVAGIALGRTLDIGQSPYENFQFRRLVRASLDGDADALAKLVDLPDGGGAGSYDHGAVLVHILMRVGDGRFSRMAAGMDMRTKVQLDGLLAAGFEYGLPKSVNIGEARLMYPLTLDAIEIKKDRFELSALSTRQMHMGY